MKNCGLDEDGHTHSYLLWLFYVTSIRNATETRGSRSRSAPAVTLRIDGDPAFITKEVCVALVGGGHGQTDSHPLSCSSTHTEEEEGEEVDLSLGANSSLPSVSFFFFFFCNDIQPDFLWS